MLVLIIRITRRLDEEITFFRLGIENHVLGVQVADGGF